MKATLIVEGFNPTEVTLVSSVRPRFRVETNLTQWHVIDSNHEPTGATGVSGSDDHSIAMWQRNQFGDGVCKRKCETLCKLLNELHDKANAGTERQTPPNNQ